MPITAAPTVRESLEAAVTEVAPEVVDTPAPVVDAPATEQVVTAPVTAPEETEAQKAERLRNDDGTFAKGKPAAKAPEVPAPAVAAKPKAPRPTSWKKELEAQWETLPPEIQAYVNEREKQYATGVSTYKGEADRAKGITTALAKYEPMLQKKGIATEKWIDQMGIAHYMISEGTSQQRVESVAQIIRQNNIDIGALGQLLAGQQPVYQQTQQQPMQMQQSAPVDIEAKVQEALNKQQAELAYKAFTADVETKYPHFADEAVKGTMARLLESGLAQDYPSAYAAALSMPQHKHLVAAAPAAPAPVVAPAEAKTQAAARARSQAVSVKSSTPSAMAPATGPKSLRDTLSDAVSQHSTSPRV